MSSEPLTALDPSARAELSSTRLPDTPSANPTGVDRRSHGLARTAGVSQSATFGRLLCAAAVRTDRASSDDPGVRAESGQWVGRYPGGVNERRPD
jgi:hypothetical protein